MPLNGLPVNRDSALNRNPVTVNPDPDLKSFQCQPLVLEAKLLDIGANQVTESLYTLNTGCALVLDLNAPLKL